MERQRKMGFCVGGGSGGGSADGVGKEEDRATERRGLKETDFPLSFPGKEK